MRMCQNRCKHSKCKRRCGEMCPPCMEPCEWKCEHLQCTKLCSEPCNRKRCNQPCRKRLNCGHLCIGLCGEPCPTECRTCDEEKVTAIVFGSEDEPDARFVLLEDCRHIIESTALDQWMDQAAEGSNTTIQLKRCPICRTPVRKSFRYGTIINSALNDIEAVKKRILGNQTRVKEMERTIKRTLENSSGAHKSVFKSRLADMTIPKTEEGLTALLNQINLLKSLKKLETDWDNIHVLQFSVLKTNERTLFDHLCSWLLEERSFMTEQEINDAERELDRSKALLALVKVQQTILDMKKQLEPALKREVKTLERLLEKSFSDEIKQRSQDLMKRLREFTNVPGLGITEAERVMIVKAVGLSQGHWYKCPRGHVYAIGECGGANEGGKCPECNAPIGGVSHRLAEGNEFAPVMDGARFPAYSEEANMNLNLLDLME